MRAEDVVETILTGLELDRLDETVDTFKEGDPAAPVTGIVTTFMGTLAVLQQAAELGANFVITHEPIYYGHHDETDWLEGHAVLEAKQRFIREHELVIWRFHDYWHRAEPDGILAGVTAKLGWEQWRDDDEPWLFHTPEIRLDRLASSVRERLGARAVRVVGEAAMPCQGVVLMPGAPGERWQIEALAREDVDVVVGGECREWMTCEYVRDAIAAGMDKGLILAGHCNSEEAGMERLADWLRPRVAGVPVAFVPASDPFWPA